MSKPWSVWDYWGPGDREFARVRVQRITHYNELRRQIRVRDVEAFAARAPEAPSAQALAADLKNRAQHWLIELDSGRESAPVAAIRPRWAGTVAFGAGIAAPFVLIAASLALVNTRWFVPGLAVVVPVAAIGLAPTLVLARRATQKLGAAFRARRCLDCGRDLSEVAAAIDPAELQGQWVGPATCPGCEAPWPMVPPVTSSSQSSFSVGQ